MQRDPRTFFAQMPPGLRFARLLPCGIALAAGAGCTEAVVPTRSGAADLPLESTVVIGVPSDRAITYRVVAPASSGLYVTATAQNAEARIFAGHAGETSTAMSIGVEPTVGFGPLRSATFPVGPTGEVQLAVMAAVPGGPAPTVQQPDSERGRNDGGGPCRYRIPGRQFERLLHPLTHDRVDRAVGGSEASG